jgi:hypothetical protein
VTFLRNSLTYPPRIFFAKSRILVTVGARPSFTPVVASLRRINSISMRNEAFEWMRAVQQTAIPRSTLEKQLGHVMELRKLLKGMRNGPSPQRKKAMPVLFLERGIKWSLVRSFLHLS